MSETTLPSDRRIAQWIEPNPYRPGDGNARIQGTGVPVWALIGYLPVVGNDPDRAATDYELPLEAVEAALAYYARHRKAIDVRLAENAGVA